jgi:hypothetical protein
MGLKILLASGSLLFLAAVPGLAQANQASFTLGAAISNDATLVISGTQAPPLGTFPVQVQTGFSFQATFSHRIASFRVTRLNVELPLFIAPNRGVESVRFPHPFPSLFSSLFFTPPLNAMFLPQHRVSPFASLGVGLVHFGESFAQNTKAAGQFGGGLDFATRIPHLSLRTEVRDYVSGRPIAVQELLGIPNTVQHNIYFGGGANFHF